MSTQTEFINNLQIHATRLAKKYGLYASVMIAQAIHESGWGHSELSLPPNFNLFGIKGSYNGNSVIMKTWEDDGKGNPYYINAAFRKYPSYYESMEDNAKLLRNGISGNPHFYNGTWKENAKTYREATQYLQGRYATDTRYASKLNALIQGYDLTKYDTLSNEYNQKEMGEITMSGSFKTNDNIYVYDEPKVKAGKHITMYKKNEVLQKFDKVHFKNGYVWLEYTRGGSNKGKKGYLPIAPLPEIWGTLS